MQMDGSYAVAGSIKQRGTCCVLGTSKDDSGVRSMHSLSWQAGCRIVTDALTKQILPPCHCSVTNTEQFLHKMF